MPSDSDLPRPALLRPATAGLLVLTFINLFNYLDRYVPAALLGTLEKVPSLHLNDARAGLLLSGFIVVYMIASPLFGALGDRGVRTRWMALGVALWSVATALGGFARTFLELLGARAAVGIGEAAYGTIAPSLIADYYPERTRGKALTTFYAAIPVGAALGYTIGSAVDVRWGWRAAFWIAGIPGLGLAVLTLFLREPARGVQDAPPAPEEVVRLHAIGQARTYLALLRNRRYLLTILGYSAYTFAIGGLAWWFPTFLQRVRGVPKETASTEFGAIVIVTGFIGTFAGGWLADALLKATRQAYLWFSAAVTLAAAPAAAVALLSPRPATYLTATIIGELLLFASTGPVNAVIVNIVPPAVRARAVALSIFAIHVLGDVPSPWLIGRISDASGLARAVLIVPLAVAVAGIVWALAALDPRRATGISGRAAIRTPR